MGGCGPMRCADALRCGDRIGGGDPMACSHAARRCGDPIMGCGGRVLGCDPMGGSRLGAAAATPIGGGNTLGVGGRPRGDPMGRSIPSGVQSSGGQAKRWTGRVVAPSGTAPDGGSLNQCKDPPTPDIRVVMLSVLCSIRMFRAAVGRMWSLAPVKVTGPMPILRRVSKHTERCYRLLCSRCMISAGPFCLPASCVSEEAGVRYDCGVACDCGGAKAPAACAPAIPHIDPQFGRSFLLSAQLQATHICAGCVCCDALPPVGRSDIDECACASSVSLGQCGGVRLRGEST